MMNETDALILSIVVAVFFFLLGTCTGTTVLDEHDVNEVEICSEATPTIYGGSIPANCNTYYMDEDLP